jgi:hypothetical protein
MAGHGPGGRCPASDDPTCYFRPWVFPGTYDANGLWRPLPQTEKPPAKFHWKNPDCYLDLEGPPSPGRTRSGRAYGTDQIHCLDPFDTHLAPEDENVHTAVVGVGQNGHPKCCVGKGWVPYTDAIAEVWPDVRPRTIQGESRVWAQAIWGW